MVILLIGFPKSGTSSFQKLFEMMGIESYHQFYHDIPIAKQIRQNLDHQKPLLEGFKHPFAITQFDYCHEDFAFWPQITHYQQLYEENKDAYFILNKRNPVDLLKSFKKWNQLDQRILRYNPELFPDSSTLNEDKKDERLLSLFQRHYDNVETFFSSLHTDANFLRFEIDQDQDENLRRLGTFLNMDVTGIKFPHENKNTI
jgi:hypothetical protein